MCNGSSCIKSLMEMDIMRFVSLFGNVVENNNQIAGVVYSRLKGTTISEVSLIVAFLEDLSFFNQDRKIDALKRYSPLGHNFKDLSRDSQDEQTSAGLTKLDNNSKGDLIALNNYFLESFGFPFVICAKLNDVESILKEMEKRALYDKEEQIELAFNEVKKITVVRIQAVFASMGPQMSKVS
uniref:2-oxo-4-hydroxy-4-carboxy-5-ureidoimidazoline decarboxylase n=1 Tax=Caligus rogercresseyi TaxID=217165 RepID=C1BMW2_CALRO|nr:2-oxo-4-hydroxy-4-carboxy-5-ureidoimidazoline decarboxylase [Caligus rogercresseyi]